MVAVVSVYRMRAMMSMMERKWHLGVVSLTKNMRQIDANLVFLRVKSRV